MFLRERGRGEPERAVPLPPASRHHPQKGAVHASEQSRPDVMEAREAWFEGQLDLDPERVVFLDETAAATNMERRFGQAPRGERCRIAVPHGHYKTTTVTAALRASGPFAVSLMDGATTCALQDLCDPHPRACAQARRHGGDG